MRGDEWGSSEMQFLRSVTVQAFEKEIRAASGKDLQLLAQKGFGFVKNAGLPEGDYGNTPHTLLQACR
ncbi:hypothetical protein PAGU2196_49900 [Pseudomonas sp. PAGU 2196]|nr:hypothetical protein PAGU2196_49900 [Pseudomonas sp. PAGU 2196]